MTAEGVERRKSNPEKATGKMETRIIPILGSEFSLERTIISGGVIRLTTKPDESLLYECKYIDAETKKTLTAKYTVGISGSSKGEVVAQEEGSSFPFPVALDEVGYFNTEGDAITLVLEKLVPAKKTSSSE